MSRWRRILYVLFFAQMMALIGFSFVFPFLPLYIQTLGVHGPAVPIWSGVISFALSISMAFVAPVWGALADRYGRKPMVVRAMAAGVCTTGLLIIAPNIWFVLALRILQGIFTGSVSASQALVASVTPRDKMGFSMGMMQSAVFMGAAAGPLVGGFLDDRLGFHGTFAVGAGMLLAATLLVIFFVDEDFKRPTTTGSARVHPIANLRGIAAVAGLPAMALVLFMAEFGNVVPAPVLALFVPHLRGVPMLHGQPQTATAVGTILAIAGVCAALSSSVVQRLQTRFGYRRVLVVSIGLAGVAYIPAFFAQSVWQLIVVRAAVGFCLGMAMPSATAIVGLVAPENRRASAFSMIASASSFGIAIGPLVGGGLGAVNLRLVFLVTAVVLVAVAVVVATTVREPESADSYQPSTISSQQSAVSSQQPTISAQSGTGRGTVLAQQEVAGATTSTKKADS